MITPKRQNQLQRTPRGSLGTGACLNHVRLSPSFRAGFFALALLSMGCQSTMNTPFSEIKTGDWKAAQIATEKEISNSKSSRRWMLSRMRTGVCALDAGETQTALNYFSQSYEVIRTQGLNDDRTIPAYLVNESVKIWKGEPFEQAMMLAYYGILQAELNSWDNCRAASDNALFSLRNLEKKPSTSAGNVLSNNGYLTEPTDFALGHLLMAISAQQLKRPEEASDHLTRALQLRPELANDIETIRTNHYNAVLVVSYGLGPRKESFSPSGDGLLADNTCTRYMPLTFADANALSVSPSEGTPSSHLPILNLNQMADDHRWRDLEDMRKIKSVIGNVGLIGGLFVLNDAAQRGGSNKARGAEALIGLGIIGVSALLKASSQAQVEYCDTFPQRMFVVPLWVDKPTAVKVELLGHPEAAAAVVVNPPDAAHIEATMTYLRLPGF